MNLKQLSTHTESQVLITPPLIEHYLLQGGASFNILRIPPGGDASGPRFPKRPRNTSVAQNVQSVQLPVGHTAAGVFCRLSLTIHQIGNYKIIKKQRNKNNAATKVCIPERFRCVMATSRLFRLNVFVASWPLAGCLDSENLSLKLGRQRQGPAPKTPPCEKFKP